jgi:DNA repair protein RecN (Recombination protein N)
MEIFNHEHRAIAALDLLGIESVFFDDAMNELRAHLDSATEKFSALEDVDVEEVLNRIEAISGLKRRYGSILEALVYKEQKKQEFAKNENIEIAKSDLSNRYNILSTLVESLATQLSDLREKELVAFSF